MNEIIPIRLGLVYAYLVKGKSKSILIDFGFPGQEKKILRALARHGVEKGDISLLVVTHGDIDHYGSVAALRTLLAAPVLVHEADSEIIRTGINRKIPASKPMAHLMKYMALLLTTLTKHRYRPFEPDVIMRTEQFRLDAYGLDGYLLHSPGETAGSLSLILPDGQVIAGDLIGGLLPHTAIPAYSPFSSNIGDVKKSLQRILSLQPRIIYTGHSKPIEVKKNLLRLQRLAGQNLNHGPAKK